MRIYSMKIHVAHNLSRTTRACNFPHFLHSFYKKKEVKKDYDHLENVEKLNEEQKLQKVKQLLGKLTFQSSLFSLYNL